jgi:hypothetical protein
MNAKTLAQVLLRVWGVVLVVSALAAAGNMLLLLASAVSGRSGGWRASEAAALLYPVVYLIAGSLLIRRGDQIGSWLTSDIDVDAGTPASALEIQVVAFSIVGLYFLVTGLRDLANAAAAALANLQWREPGTLSYIWERQRQLAVAGVVNTVAGIVLLVRRQNIAEALSKTWRVVRSRETSADQDPE